jgi:hypothetical protein
LISPGVALPVTVSVAVVGYGKAPVARRENRSALLGQQEMQRASGSNPFASTENSGVIAMYALADRLAVEESARAAIGR